MMQDGNKNRSKCGVMLALVLGRVCCVLCYAIACVLLLGMSRRSVGRSIRFSGGRESSDFFPSPFPPP